MPKLIYFLVYPKLYMLWENQDSCFTPAISTERDGSRDAVLDIGHKELPLSHMKNEQW